MLDRSRFLGGSDCAAVTGISPWKTLYEVWLEKTGQSEPMQDNRYTYWGRMLEPVVRQAYEESTGRKVEVPPTILHPQYSFIGGNLDGTAAGRVVEIKTASTDKDWGEEGTDNIPAYYLTQCQHYMMLTGLPVTDVPVLIGGNDFRIYHVEADKELQEMLLDAEVDFWQRYVAPRITPPLTELRDIVRAYPKSLRNALNATADVMLAGQRFKQLKAQINNLEAEKALEEAIIKGFMRENDTVIDDSGKAIITWKSPKDAAKFNEAQFAKDNPELYKQYTRFVPSGRRLLVK